MTKQGINPEFSEVSGLIAQAGGHRVSETMKGNGSRQANRRFEFGEIPAKICATRAAFRCFQFREQEFLAVFPEIQNTPVQQAQSSKALWMGTLRVPASVLGAHLSSG